MEFKEKKRWVFLGLPLTFTTYTIKEEVLTINEGFLNQRENDCYMYKIQDVTLNSSLMERIFGLGTIVCSTGAWSFCILKTPGPSRNLSWNSPRSSA